MVQVSHLALNPKSFDRTTERGHAFYLYKGLQDKEPSINQSALPSRQQQHKQILCMDEETPADGQQFHLSSKPPDCLNPALTRRSPE